jgi:hypothetical protein
MQREKHILSKSTFMYGVQCKKRLYLHKNGKKFGIEKDGVSAQQEAIFSTGTNVGELAQKLFPGGIDCTPESYYDFGPSLDKTTALLAKKHPAIYEAAFQFDQVLVALDILVLKNDGWHAYEVKSTNGTKDTHIQDAALQYWVMVNSGLEIKSINVLHFNREYVRQGDLNVQELFTWDDVTEEVLNLQPEIETEIKANKDCLKEPTIPNIEIGSHCSNPYSCDFMGTCWKHVPNYSVFNLTRGGSKAWELHDQGILNIEDIPDNFPLSDSQQLQVEAEKSGRVYIDKEGIKAFVEALNYPLYFLDFETIMPAVPEFDQTRPYQMSVFQYSLHVQRSVDAPVEHYECLAEPTDRNLRTTVAKQLISEMGKTGDVIVYNKSFEASRLNELARDFPKYSSALEAVRDRMVDLATPFQRKMYYAKEMRGSYSIKVVLPALVPELSYKDLEIQEGGTASLTFLQMVQGQFKGDVTKTRQNLIKYCELDTLAMVKILARLQGI